jgi:hypothetical protein
VRHVRGLSDAVGAVTVDPPETFRPKPGGPWGSGIPVQVNNG